MPTIDVRDPTDAQLMAASRFDGVHFATVLDRHAPTVHRYLSDRLGPEVASAHLGEVFATAYTSRRHFRSWGGSARPWLLGTATGVVRTQWR
jgi:RNA polymerase sigma-70 factor (ECF subfamily)